MWFNMALTTFGHNFLVIVFHRVVVVKFLMTVLAVNLVPFAILLDFGKNTGMALGTLGNGKGLRSSDIHFCTARCDDAVSWNSGVFSRTYLYT